MTTLTMMAEPVQRLSDTASGGPKSGRDAARSARTAPGTTIAIEAVYDRCAEALHRFFLVRTGRDNHLSQDLMQQLWVAALKTGRAVPEGELEFWLRAVARRLLATHWRRASVRGRSISLDATNAPVIAGDTRARDLSQRLTTTHLTPDLVADNEVRQRLLLAITDLSPDDQTLIFAHYFEGAPQTTIAQRLNVSPRAIEGRLYRARQALRRRLSQLEQD